MSDAIVRLAQHVTRRRFEDLSPEAIAAVKTFCLDTLGVCVAGTSAPYAAAVQTAARGWGAGAEATAIGLGEQFPAPTAAFLNAFHTHNQEFDCVHELAVVHPLTTVQSAALAYAERSQKIPGREFILALVLGVDVATSIGMAARTGLKFFRPATAGVFGVAAAVGKLAGLDQAALLDAFGLAYAQAAGSMQAHTEGGPALALQIAFAAAAGMRAVDLAQAGFPAPHDVLEGRYGYFPLFEGAWDIHPVWAELGHVWRITQISHKPFPSGRATHGGVDGILQLRARHAIQADSVESVILRAPSLIYELVGRPLTPAMQVNYARLCFQYVGALALATGGVDMADFSPQRLADAGLHALGQRLRVVIDDNPDPNALSPQTIIIRLKNGAEHALTISNTLGSPLRPLTRQQHLAKFRRCLTVAARPLAADAGERLIAMVEHLENLPQSHELLQPLQPVAL
jgi:2-methylcitrate dehydratase PrpD